MTRTRFLQWNARINGGIVFAVLSRADERPDSGTALAPEGNEALSASSEKSRVVPSRAPVSPLSIGS